MKNFVALVGSEFSTSTNRHLLQYMKTHFSAEATIELISLTNLPIFKKTDDRFMPEPALALIKKILPADGVIIGTPEYDHAVPALLLNALAWASYTSHPFVNKPVMITGASYGSLGSSRAQAQLRQVLDSPEIKARVMPGSEFLLGHSLEAFSEQGLIDEETSQQLDGLFKDFLLFVDISAALNNTDDIKKAQSEAFSWDDK